MIALYFKEEHRGEEESRQEVSVRYPCVKIYVKKKQPLNALLFYEEIMRRLNVPGE